MKLNEIEIENGFLQDREKLFNAISPFGNRFAIITHENIAELYGNPLLETLNAAGLNAALFTFPAGEKNKSRESKAAIEDQLLGQSFGRDSCIIALGGGIVTDFAGFVAATFARGIPYVSIPTSLLAMVDASVGGKTGVNTPFGKNLIGAIYQPRKVIIDPDTLKTLPFKNLSEGFVEMIKHGLVADAAYFSFLETHSKELLSLDFNLLNKAIFESCKIKKTIVEEDEREGGKRRLLNYGHTVGHALEKLTDYTLSHGEAVALGLLVEGQFSTIDIDRIRNILTLYGLPLQMPSFSVEQLLNAMVLDKKSLKGKPRFVVLQEIGTPLPFDGHYCTEIDPALLAKAMSHHSALSKELLLRL